MNNFQNEYEKSTILRKTVKHLISTKVKWCQGHLNEDTQQMLKLKCENVTVFLSPSSTTPFFDTDPWTSARDASRVPG